LLGCRPWLCRRIEIQGASVPVFSNVFNCIARQIAPHLLVTSLRSSHCSSQSPCTSPAATPPPLSPPLPTKEPASPATAKLHFFARYSAYHLLRQQCGWFCRHAPDGHEALKTMSTRANRTCYHTFTHRHTISTHAHFNNVHGDTSLHKNPSFLQPPPITPPQPPH
jgi:hypothetical protein